MKKTKLRRKSLVKNNEWYRKKCVELAKRIVRHESDYKCEYCGNGEPDRTTHGSHVFSEGVNHGMSADLDNIICLCAAHHMAASPWNRSDKWSWHNSPAEAVEWFKEKWPERYASLKIRSQNTIKKDFKLLHYELKEKFNKLIN